MLYYLHNTCTVYLFIMLLLLKQKKKEEKKNYIEMHRGPAAYVLGPPPSRGRDLELEGGVNACLVDYV